MSEKNKVVEGAISTPRTSEATHPELYSKTAELLAGLSSDEDTSVALIPAEESSDQGAEADVVVEEVQAEDSPVVDDDAGETGDASEEVSSEEGSEVSGEGESQEAATEKVSTLPAAYIRSLKSYEWTDEEIQEAFDDNPEIFLRTATKIHANRVKETSDWAAEGRKQRDANAGDTGLMGDPSQSPAIAPEPSQPGAIVPQSDIPTIDLKKMAEESGMTEESLKTAFTPVVDAIIAINQVLPALNQSVASIESDRQAELSRQVDEFFQSPDMKGYQEFYGESWEKVTDQQLQNRNDVLVLADNMMVGAAQHGRALEVFDSMGLAHHSVASEVKESVVRKTIAKQVDTRRKGLSLKPKGKDLSATSAPSKETQFISDTRARLNKAFS